MEQTVVTGSAAETASLGRRLGELLEEGDFITASANVILSVLVCLLFTWVGITTARYL